MAVVFICELLRATATNDDKLIKLLSSGLNHIRHNYMDHNKFTIYKYFLYERVERTSLGDVNFLIKKMKENETKKNCHEEEESSPFSAGGAKKKR